jgi:hypothetical protein
MDDTEQRIAVRAYHLWEQDGRPNGQDLDHWERARFLIGIEDSGQAGQLPNPSIPTVQNPSGTAPSHPPAEPVAEAIENLGEFPGLTDQGERAQAPRVEPPPDASDSAAAAPKKRRGMPG